MSKSTSTSGFPSRPFTTNVSSNSEDLVRSGMLWPEAELFVVDVRRFGDRNDLRLLKGGRPIIQSDAGVENVEQAHHGGFGQVLKENILDAIHAGGLERAQRSLGMRESRQSYSWE